MVSNSDSVQVRGDYGEKIAKKYLEKYFDGMIKNNQITSASITDVSGSNVGYDLKIEIVDKEGVVIERYAEVKYRENCKDYKLTDNEADFAEKNKETYDMIFVSSEEVFYCKSLFMIKNVSSNARDIPKHLAVNTMRIDSI